MSGRALALAFAAVVGSFLATNLIAQRSSAEAGELAEGIGKGSTFWFELPHAGSS